MGHGRRDRSWVMRLRRDLSWVTTRSRGWQDRLWVTTRGRWDQSWVTTAPMRLVLGGSVFGGDAISVGCDWSGVMRSSVVMRSRWWCEIYGGASAGVRSVLGESVTLSSLSLSFSLRVWNPKMVCSENKSVNQFPGQSHKTHGQLKCFFGKFYFPCTTKHAVRCKIISWNGFTPNTNAA